MTTRAGIGHDDDGDGCGRSGGLGAHASASARPKTRVGGSPFVPDLLGAPATWSDHSRQTGHADVSFFSPISILF
jgi:hypothetical protein